MLVFQNHTQLDTHPVGVLRSSEQPAVEAATYKTPNTRIAVSSAGFEHVIPAKKRPQTFALDRTNTGIGIKRA